MTDLKSALSLISSNNTDEKEVNPKTNSVKIYKKWKFGTSLSKDEKSALKEWLSGRVESLKQKAAEIEKDEGRLR